ncbi:MAG: hypothetical protein J0M04_16025 [Verrucomicrobia bacterium]|nr:hypothetical protein [Verrucomicrobiota bacterium]
MALDELEPDYNDLSVQPKTLTRTRHIKNVLWLAGRGPAEDDVRSDVMFVTSAVEDEEMQSSKKSLFG